MARGQRREGAAKQPLANAKQDARLLRAASGCFLRPTENSLLLLTAGEGLGIFASLLGSLEVVQPPAEPGRVRLGGDTPWGGISSRSVLLRAAPARRAEAFVHSSRYAREVIEKQPHSPNPAPSVLLLTEAVERPRGPSEVFKPTRSSAGGY